jgi:hypothetical protein
MQFITTASGSVFAEWLYNESYNSHSLRLLYIIIYWNNIRRNQNDNFPTHGESQVFLVGNLHSRFSFSKQWNYDISVDLNIDSVPQKSLITSIFVKLHFLGKFNKMGQVLEIFSGL